MLTLPVACGQVGWRHGSRPSKLKPRKRTVGRSWLEQSAASPNPTSQRLTHQLLQGAIRKPLSTDEDAYASHQALACPGYRRDHENGWALFAWAWLLLPLLEATTCGRFGVGGEAPCTQEPH